VIDLWKFVFSFWNQPSENTPECRVEMALHRRRAQQRQDEAKKTAKKRTTNSQTIYRQRSSVQFERSENIIQFGKRIRKIRTDRANLQVNYTVVDLDNLKFYNPKYRLPLNCNTCNFFNFRLMDTDELDVDVQAT